MRVKLGIVVALAVMCGCSKVPSAANAAKKAYDQSKPVLKPLGEGALKAGGAIAVEETYHAVRDPKADAKTAP